MPRFSERIFMISPLVVALLFLYAPANYLVMLFKSFAFQFMVLFSLAGLFWIWRGRWVPSLGSFAGALLLFTLMPPLWGDHEGPPSGQKGIKLAHFNVLRYNRDHDSVITRALETDADLLSFQEVGGEWGAELKRHLTQEYPFSCVISREHTNGLALFSRFPLLEVDTTFVEEFPSLLVRVALKGQPIHVALCHAKAPSSPAGYRLRNRQFRAMADLLKKREGPKFLVGDLNAVPWDRELIALKRDTGLHDGRRSLASTFPKTFDFGWIPIDHIFHSEAFDCVGFSAMGGTSSDHLGILGTYQFRRL